MQAGRRYAYVPEHGPLALAEMETAAGDVELTVSGQTLLDMSRDDYSRAETRDESRRLMRRLIAALAIALVLGACTSSGPAPAANRPPNRELKKPC